MIHNEQYKHWSKKVHEDHNSDPLVIQMELTYRCPIRCVHCYSDCYNNAETTKRELSTEQVKQVIDKLYDGGALWLTFTGGDPLMRQDFVELYRYACAKGFILSVMTSLVTLPEEVFQAFKEQPPFVIDMTLNGVTPETYEKVTKVKGSFQRVMKNIERVRNAGLSFKIKTMLNTINIEEAEAIQQFVEGKGLVFNPSAQIFARLNGDTSNLIYRLPQEETDKLPFSMEKGCAEEVKSSGRVPQTDQMYRCATANWQWFINPQGKLNVCTCLRDPDYDLLTGDLKTGMEELRNFVRNATYKTDSACRQCTVWDLCSSCPPKAKNETGGEENPIEYFCRQAHARAEREKKT